MNPLYFTVPLLFGFVCAGIASARNRSTVGWFAIGFLISIVGFILILVLPAIENDEDYVQEPGTNQYRPKREIKRRSEAFDGLAQLAELKAHGLLNEAEFAAKKSELLARI